MVTISEIEAYRSGRQDEREELLKVVNEIINDIKAEIEEEKEYAYADFDEYNNEVLGFDDTDVCERDLCCIGLGRALQIINKHISGKEQ